MVRFGFRLLPALTEDGFCWFLASIFASSFARTGYQIVCAWLLVAGGDGSAAVANFFLLVSMTELIASPAAGWLADHCNRRKICMVADTAHAAAMICVAMTQPETATQHVIWISAVLYAVGDRLSLTSSQAMIPTVGITLTLAARNAAVFFIMQAGALCAAILVGVMLHASTASAAFLSLSAAFLAGGLFMAGATSGDRRSADPQFPSAVQAFDQMDVLRIGSLYSLLYSTGLIVSVLAAGFVRDELVGTALDFGMVEGAWSIGSVIGAIMIARVARSAGLESIQITCLTLAALSFFVLTLASLPSVIGLFVVLGALYNLGRAAAEMQLQSAIPSSHLGRAKGWVHCGCVVLGLALFASISLAPKGTGVAALFQLYAAALVFGTVTFAILGRSRS
ncbi:hypothetical protein C8J36_1119 [Rhizobium sp. PP-F2F-G48]|uniref:MFS transporter n=1 Tax=Rhizobium sp. PP-F2F-G48 TaxID=2135651 RepID=UPI001044FA4B|nr:MFS transporter [Rhizobium sp. PP-F2F-G48]TCM50677.1 hypothetical protein C8J36_1119 [Rhizobium sp. PP-F2F-G48]